MKKNNIETWVKEQIEYYKPFLGISIQKVKVKYDSDVSYFSVSLSYPYLSPTIFYGNGAIDKFNNDKIDKQTILHELCHIITDPLYVKATQRYASEDEVEGERERLTDTISTIITNLLEKQ